MMRAAMEAEVDTERAPMMGLRQSRRHIDSRNSIHIARCQREHARSVGHKCDSLGHCAVTYSPSALYEQNG
jgi:hypothetical protein